MEISESLAVSVSGLDANRRRLNVIAEESTAVPADGARIRFDKSRVHVYADGRIVEGQAIGAESVGGAA